MGEKRSASRRRTYFSAQLTFQTGAGALDCVVRNLGPGGAMVELPHPPEPDRLDLRIPVSGLHQRTQVAWRLGRRLGLAFTQDLARTGATARSAPWNDDACY